MRKKKGETVIIVWGGPEIQNYYDFKAWTKENVLKILEHVKLYDFDTFEEAEAFRQGMCAVVSKSARDFMELPPQGYKALLDIVRKKK